MLFPNSTLRGANIWFLCWAHCTLHTAHFLAAGVAPAPPDALPAAPQDAVTDPSHDAESPASDDLPPMPAVAPPAECPSLHPETLEDLEADLPPPPPELLEQPLEQPFPPPEDVPDSGIMRISHEETPEQLQQGRSSTLQLSSILAHLHKLNKDLIWNLMV